MNKIEMTRKFVWFAAASLPLAGATAFAQEKPLTPEEQEFFESKIRPALIENCYKCHSAEKDAKVKGGLQVDSKAALLKGGSTGPAIVPGNPEKSLFIKAIRHTDPNLQMPPKDKMPDSVVADFEQWVRMGAPDPRTGKAAGVLKSDADKEKAKQHWSFKPIKKPEPPKPKSHLKTWVQNDIDLFVLAKMEEKGLLPAPPADRLTLVRRAYFDLTGLPPTPTEVESFLNDESPDAWSKLIDKLLASPRYGERWGRYWLDYARYADTKGARNNRMQENVMSQAYTYRDWVINAINDDLRYDKFLTYQIAADKAKDAQKKDLAAMGFMMIGRAGNNQQEVIDDRIDAITRGMMSLSVYCARCHDHKFDPIPTQDYYSLYGVFASCIEPGEKPIIEADNSSPEFKDYLRQKAQIEAELEGYRMGELAKHLATARANTDRYMLLAHVMIKDPEKRLGNRADQQKFDQMYKLDFNVMGPWFNFLNGERSKKDSDPVWGPWAMYHKLEDREFAAKSKEIAAKFSPSNEASKKYNALVARAFATPASDMKVVAERYAKLFNDSEKAWSAAMTLNEKKKANAKDDEKIATLKGLADPAQEELRRVYQGSPATFTYAQIARQNNNRIGNGEQQFSDRMLQLEIKNPGAPRRAMVMEDRPGTPVTAKVMIKGSPQNLGPEAPRRFLEVLSGPDRKNFPANSSGRLELAESIASDKNPLTARVLANRLWMNHFGAPLVRTPTDFGVRADEPTHPELLDYLASYFIENGWSVKKLHKLIMMSNIYQQSSDDRPKCNAVDPANSLVWKMNRRRLDFESFRDSLLSISGKLDEAMGGPPVNIASANDRFHKFDPYRRTVYAKVDRGNLATVFSTFDFANPDITTGQRFSSTVPQQALYMMNSGWLTDLARDMVSREDFKKEMDEDQRIVLLYQIAFQRPPSEVELKLGKRFLEVQSGMKSGPANAPVWQYGYGQYDAAGKKVASFYKLSVLTTAKAWSTEPQKQAQLGNIALDAAGGRTSSKLGISVIRRWTAPRDVTVSIDGALSHTGMMGRSADGVTGFIVSSRGGELGRFTAAGRPVDTKVARVDLKKGDTIDFVVNRGVKGGPLGEAFTWAPVVRVAGAAPMMMNSMAAGNMNPAEASEWRAAADFGAGGKAAPQKPFGTWEKYAQVLLLSNEIAFLD